jgi:hypothetical protein
MIGSAQVLSISFLRTRALTIAPFLFGSTFFERVIQPDKHASFNTRKSVSSDVLRAFRFSGSSVSALGDLWAIAVAVFFVLSAVYGILGCSPRAEAWKGRIFAFLLVLGNVWVAAFVIAVAGLPIIRIVRRFFR